VLPFVGELSEGTPVRPWTVLVVALEALSKLLLLGTLFALFVAPEDPVKVASLTAGAAALVATARTLAKGELLRRAIEDVFGALRAELQARTVPELLTRRAKLATGALFETAHEVASARASALPEIAASTIVLGVVLLAVAVRLGPKYLGLGLLGALALVIILAPLRRRARRSNTEAWVHHTSIMRSLDALVFGAFELRGSGAESAANGALAATVARVSRLERESHWLGVTTAVIPAVVALGVTVLPRDWMTVLLTNRLGEASVLVAAGVSATTTFVTALESVARSAPARVLLASLFERPVGLWGALSKPPRPGGELPDRTTFHRLSMNSFTHRYTASGPATPEGVSFDLTRPGGVVLVGPNGAGKTTTLLALLGLLPSDAVRIDGRPPDAATWAALRRNVFVLPQRAHLVPDETVAWHLSLFGARPVAPERALAALDTLGVGGMLRARAERKRASPLEVTLGELSGGEQRRVLLARLLVSDAELFILDEPEAGLDDTSRAKLSELLSKLARTHLVIVVSHHPSTIPREFTRVSVGNNVTSPLADAAIVLDAYAGDASPDR
jgi:ABC-type transport system involved in cytochrome bd biosynthesis fused ATPase/permease subunit